MNTDNVIDVKRVITCGELDEYTKDNLNVEITEIKRTLKNRK
jgi:hypothetical protein